MGFGWVILTKMRNIIALAVVAALGTGAQEAAGETWTDLGIWGPVAGAGVAAVVGLLTPERVERLRAYIAGKGGALEAPTPPTNR